MCLFSYSQHVGLAKKLVHVFGNIIWKNPNELFGQPNTYWASLIAQLVKNPPAMQETPVPFLGQKVHWRRDRLPTLVFLGFRCDSAGKESACNARDLGSIPGSGRSPGKGKATHSSILAWRIPWIVFMGLQRAGHD